MFPSRTYVPLVAAVACLVAFNGVNADVKELTSANFEHDTQVSTGATTGDWFVAFTAPWCGHCKDLAPTWEELADKLEGEVNVAKVDATAHRDLTSRFEVKGFPTIIFFRRGNMYKYQGQRTLVELEKFALGGYSNVDAVEAPKAQSTIEVYSQLFVKLINASDPFVLVMSILGGSLIGAVASYFLLFRTENQKLSASAAAAAAPKPAAPAAAAKEEEAEDEEEEPEDLKKEK